MKKYKAITHQVDAVVSDLFSKISKIDDQLGYFSDYEGGWESGPTFYLWQCGKERFEKRCEEAIYLHSEAIKLWEKARKLNNSR